MSPTGRLVCFVGMERSDHQLHTARQGAAHRAHRPARGGARGTVFFGQPSRVPLQREWHQETRSCARCPALGLCNRHAARRDQAAAGRTCVLCEVGISSRQTKGSGPQPFAIPCCMRAFIMGLLLLLEVEQNSLGRSGWSSNSRFTDTVRFAIPRIHAQICSRCRRESPRVNWARTFACACCARGRAPTHYGGSVGQGLKDRGTLLIPDPACTL